MHQRFALSCQCAEQWRPKVCGLSRLLLRTAWVFQLSVMLVDLVLRGGVLVQCSTAPRKPMCGNLVNLGTNAKQRNSTRNMHDQACDDCAGALPTLSDYSILSSVRFLRSIAVLPRDNK